MTHLRRWLRLAADRTTVEILLERIWKLCVLFGKKWSGQSHRAWVNSIAQSIYCFISIFRNQNFIVNLQFSSFTLVHTCTRSRMYVYSFTCAETADRRPHTVNRILHLSMWMGKWHTRISRSFPRLNLDCIFRVPNVMTTQLSLNPSCDERALAT